MSVLRVGHSPDADDAFMFYALANGKVTIEGFEVEQVLEDIESLNRRAMRGELEVTAISAAAYPRLADKYRIMACGASVGRNYGPTVVSTTPMTADGLENKRIAIPGEYTTAYLLIRIYLGRPFTPVFLHFDEIVEAVGTGKVDAGLIIHEGQITLEAQGYTTVLDLGKAWGDDTGLPIPLGLDMVHRRLGEDTSAKRGPRLRGQHTVCHRQRGCGRRVRPAIWQGNRQGYLPALRPHVRERGHHKHGGGGPQGAGDHVPEGARAGAYREHTPAGHRGAIVEPVSFSTAPESRRGCCVGPG